MSTTEGTSPMTSRTSAYQANGMADASRVRAFGPCPAMPALSLWSPIHVGTDTAKHGRPRRIEVSHP